MNMFSKNDNDSNSNKKESSSTTIPVIDLSPWTYNNTAQPLQASLDDSQFRQAQAEVVAQVAAACRDIGFFAITGHGIPNHLVDEALAAASNFFDQPQSIKLQYQTDDEATYPYGFERSENLARGKASERNNNNNNTTSQTEKEATTKSTADSKETFSMGPDHAAAPARRLPPGLTPALTTYYHAMQQLANTVLLPMFAVAWNLPPTWFAERSTRHMSALRILNYPAVSDNNNNDDDNNIRIRASAHTDYGPLTILYSGGPGLQVQKDGSNNNDDNEQGWVDVPDIPGAFIINLGDLMQRWTNGASGRATTYPLPCA